VIAARGSVDDLGPLELELVRTARNWRERSFAENNMRNAFAADSWDKMVADGNIEFKSGGGWRYAQKWLDRMT
jgi:hypothetical protein